MVVALSHCAVGSSMAVIAVTVALIHAVTVVVMVVTVVVAVADSGPMSVVIVMAGSHSGMVDMAASIIASMQAVVTTSIRQEHSGTGPVEQRVVDVAVVHMEHPGTSPP